LWHGRSKGSGCGGSGSPQTLGSENDQVRQTYSRSGGDALAKLGRIEGRNLRTDVRSGAGELTEYGLAAELVSLNPDVIVTGGAAATVAVERQTGNIPIVLVSVGDPVASGIVKNLARPEGNATGLPICSTSIAGKWVELLKKAAPRIQRVGLPYNAQLNFTGYFSRSRPAR
jgi:putative ABC transport system substrate-binding protein